MDESDIQYFLRSIGQYQTKSNAKWVYTNCPLAQWTHPSGHDRSPSFGVSIAPGDTSRFNCFAAETPVLTYDGYYPIAQLVGRASRLLTVGADGISRWVDASVESFGQQVLWRLVLSRNGVRREIRATAGHRWFVNNHGKRCEVITSDLRPGHSLSSVMPPRDDLPQFLKACPSLDIGWVVERVEQTGCVEEVFCAVVPGSACFTLEGHILTGNCFTCHQKGDVRNLLYKLSMYTGRGLDQYNDLARFLQNCNAPALSGTKAKLDRATYKARATEVSGMAVDLPMRAKPLEVVRLDENILDKFEKPSGEVLEYLTGTGEDDLGRRRRGLYHHTVTDWEIGWQDLSQRLALPVRPPPP